eukprot:2812163-Pyramimonas_sp.AAC.1
MQDLPRDGPLVRGARMQGLAQGGNGSAHWSHWRAPCPVARKRWRRRVRVRQFCCCVIINPSLYH